MLMQLDLYFLLNLLLISCSRALLQLTMYRNTHGVYLLFLFSAIFDTDHNQILTQHFFISYKLHCPQLRSQLEYCAFPVLPKSHIQQISQNSIGVKKLIAKKTKPCSLQIDCNPLESLFSSYHTRNFWY